MGSRLLGLLDWPAIFVLHKTRYDGGFFVRSAGCCGCLGSRFTSVVVLGLTLLSQTVVKALFPVYDIWVVLVIELGKQSNARRRTEHWQF